jgi:hypothetical protein
MVTTTASARRIGERVGSASRVELEYFCRNCKGHYSSTVPYAALYQSTCRCGSDDLLVYSLSGESSAPLRGH